MIAAALLLAAAAPASAVDAERAFAAMAQTQGQWTAFRAFAAPEAVMFVPEPVNAQEWLRDRSDPPQSVMWWPAKAFVSCDGSVAVTTGPWVRAGGTSHGYFTTVWSRQADAGWRWLLDHGDALAAAMPAPETVEVHKPNCTGMPIRNLRVRTGEGGSSRDASLLWNWQVLEDGGRTVSVSFWNGRGHELVLEDEIIASP